MTAPFLAKFILFAVGIGIIIVGLVCLARGTGAVHRLPRIALLKHIEINSGHIPFGLLSIVSGLALFWLVSQWKLETTTIVKTITSTGAVEMTTTTTQNNNQGGAGTTINNGNATLGP